MPRVSTTFVPQALPFLVAPQAKKKKSWWSSKEKATGLSADQLAMIYETIEFDPAAPNAAAVALSPDFSKTQVSLVIINGSLTVTNHGPLASMMFQDFKATATLREGSMSRRRDLSFCRYPPPPFFYPY